MHTQPWAVQWHSTKMSVRLGQPELVAFLDQRRAHRQRDGNGNGCHVSQTLGWRRAPWKPEGTLYNFCRRVVDIRIFSWFHASSSPTTTYTGSRAPLSAWSAPCGGSPIGLALLGTI